VAPTPDELAEGLEVYKALLAAIKDFGPVALERNPNCGLLKAWRMRIHR
jgi:hypothetical protein